MPGLKIQSGEWVIVCDGGKALILENAGDSQFPNLRTRETYEEKHPATHEQGTDVPGRILGALPPVVALRIEDGREAPARACARGVGSARQRSIARHVVHNGGECTARTRTTLSGHAVPTRLLIHAAQPITAHLGLLYGTSREPFPGLPALL